MTPKVHLRTIYDERFGHRLHYRQRAWSLLCRHFWSFFISEDTDVFAGIAIRCLAIDQPLLDAHDIRQCQTAAATESLLKQPGFHLSSRIPWAGDADVYYVQEFPIYNYLVILAYSLLHNLDVSGKLITIALWALSFLTLQFIWRRFLDPRQSRWANLLFVIAPLSVFYGQAFMPEMLIQFIAFAFVLLVIRYHDEPMLIRWVACAAVGLLGCLIKFPEIVHLYIILIILIFAREKKRALTRPRYLVAAALTIAAILFWSRYMDSVNVDPLSFGSARNNLILFLGTWQSRFHLVPWVMIFAYLAAFVAPGVGLLLAGYGLIVYFRERPLSQSFTLWLLSLLLFYLIWFGNAASSQSYYNLVALAPICGLFGIGVSKLFAYRFFVRWQRTGATITSLLVFIPAVPVYLHLFHQDEQMRAATDWVRANTPSGAIILFRPNHSSSMIDYQYNPVPAYYGKRATFIWTTNTPDIYRRAALERANYAIVTLPQTPTTGFMGMLNRFRHFDRLPEGIDWLKTAGFRLLVRESGFTVYARSS